MNYKIFICLGLVILFLASINLISCSKSNPVAPSVDQCAGKTIVVSATTTPTSSPSSSNGSISATATGSTGFTYSIGNGVFQSSGNFTGLKPNAYIVSAKDANGCLGSVSNIFVSSANCPTISLSSTTVSSDKCKSTGSITLTSSGSTGLMYNLNNGPYQASNVFSALASGIHTVGVKDANGCTTFATAQINVVSAGPFFTNVKTIMMASCAFSGCHAGSSPQSGLDLSVDCTIVALSSRIKIRSVDCTPSSMPISSQLSASDKQKIMDWINAGAQYSN